MDFAKEKYEELLLMFNIKDLPFYLASGVGPCNDEKKLDHNPSKFSISIDEWRSGNNFIFLGITSRFYSNKLESGKHSIGFEELNGKFSYSAELSFEFLMKFFNKYPIENQIKSITRDIAVPMTVMMDKYREWPRSQDVESDGDILCVSLVMNWSTVNLLNHTFFKGKASEKFDQTMEELLQKRSDFDDFAFLYHEYKNEYKDELLVVVDPGLPSPERPARYGFRSNRRAGERDEDEFERYLIKLRADQNMEDIALFKLHNSRFPIISRIARDYFAVLSMSALSEALFSRIRNIVTKNGGRLSSRPIKILAILKSRNIIMTEEMPGDNSDTEEDENLTQLDGGGATKRR